MDERTVAHIPAKPLNVSIIDHSFCMTAYCRVSSPSREQGLSLKTQVTYYTDKINGNTLWRSAGVFADTATEQNMVVS